MNRGGDEIPRVKLHDRPGQKYFHHGCDLALCASLWFRHTDAISVLNLLLPLGWLYTPNQTWTADVEVVLFILLWVSAHTHIDMIADVVQNLCGHTEKGHRNRKRDKKG